MTGYDAGNLSRFERGEQGINMVKLGELAEALGTTTVYLHAYARTGKEDVTGEEYTRLLGMEAAKSMTDLVRKIEDTGPARVVQRVPLISWVQAGAWEGIADPYEAGDAHQWVDCYMNVGDHAFALTVRGDSMTNPQGNPTFPEGSVIIVDPAEEAISGRFVIAKTEAQEEATFKRFVRDAGSVFLEPLNPRYPVIEVTGDVVVCGVVVGKAFESLI